MSRIDDLYEWCERAIATENADSEDDAAVRAMDVAWQEFADRATPQTVAALIECYRAAKAYNDRPYFPHSIRDAITKVEALG